MIRAHKFLFLGLALATWTTAGLAIADERAQMQQPTQMTAQKVSAAATVEKVDTKKRELTLKDEQGDHFMVDVPESVTRFENIKTGDKIELDYYQSAALSLKKPMKGEMPTGGEAVTAERTPGNLPGGIMSRKITATATVQKVDVGANKVTLKAPSGAMDTINVSDPALQSQLGTLKKGDRIQATYTEAVAISVTPKNKE